MPGRLITFEGLDGTGKSTQAALLAEYCLGRGWDAVVYREPGETALGEELRRLLKSGAAHSPAAELFLFAAARSELLSELARPALNAGMVVILDRFTESTLAYQGALQVFPEEVLAGVASLAADGLVPDLTVLLDIDPAAALERRESANRMSPAGMAEHAAPGAGAAGEGLDAIEQRNLEYFTRVRDRYIALQAREPQRIVRIDARLGILEVASEIRAAMEAKWPI